MTKHHCSCSDHHRHRHHHKHHHHHHNRSDDDNDNRGSNDRRTSTFSIIEHANYNRADIDATVISCQSGRDPSSPVGQILYFQNKILDSSETQQIGFSNGYGIKTVDSSQIGKEPRTASGVDYAFECTVHFAFYKNPERPSTTVFTDINIDTIVANGFFFTNKNINEGKSLLPTKFAITGGTGKYCDASGEISIMDIGCQPTTNAPDDKSLVHKMIWNFKIHTGIECTD